MKKYLQVLGVISCLAVVLLHSNGVFWAFSYERYWFTANIIESICYFAVPIFIMISGCNLIDYQKKYNTKIYFKKRIIKTVIPFFIWSFIGFVYLLTVGALSTDNINIHSVVDAVFNTGYIGVYWFFIPLFSVYLSIPALSMIPEASRKRIFQYMLLAAFAFNIAMPFVFSIIGLNYNTQLNVSLVGGYLFYAIAGYYIDRYPIEKKYRIIWYVLAGVGLAAHILGTLLLSYRDGAVNGIFKGYLNLPCVLYSVGIFILFKYLDRTRVMAYLYTITFPVADTTFGIYLIHWLLMDVFLRISHINPTSIVYRILGGFVIFIAASIIIKIIKKIPILRQIVP